MTEDQIPYKWFKYSYCGECVNDTNKNAQNQPNTIASTTSVVQSILTTKISTSKSSIKIVDEHHETSSLARKTEQKTEKLTSTPLISAEITNTERASIKNNEKPRHKTITTSPKNVLPENPQLTRIATNNSNEVGTNQVTANFMTKTNESKLFNSTILYSSQQSSSTNKNKIKKETTKSKCLVFFLFYKESMTFCIYKLVVCMSTINNKKLKS